VGSWGVELENMNRTNVPEATRKAKGEALENSTKYETSLLWGVAQCSQNQNLRKLKEHMKHINWSGGVFLPGVVGPRCSKLLLS